MLLLDLLNKLDAAGVTLTLTGTNIKASGPRSAVADLGPAIREHRDLLAAHLIGRAEGHLLAFCQSCGAPTMTAAKKPTGKPRETWPTCRARPGCGGRNQHGVATARHIPRPGDLDAMRDAKAPPALAKAPPKIDSRRLLGPRPPWPTYRSTAK